MTERTREEIISLILQSAAKEGGATQTILMYETYLSHYAIRRYLELLIEKAHLQYLPGEMKFKTTAQGIEYLLSLGTRVSSCYCNHQCKRCGVQYSCGKAGMKCHNPFHHGICQGCLKMFSYESRGTVNV